MSNSAGKTSLYKYLLELLTKFSFYFRFCLFFQTFNLVYLLHFTIEYVTSYLYFNEIYIYSYCFYFGSGLFSVFIAFRWHSPNAIHHSTIQCAHLTFSGGSYSISVTSHPICRLVRRYFYFNFIKILARIVKHVYIRYAFNKMLYYMLCVPKNVSFVTEFQRFGCIRNRSIQSKFSYFILLYYL